MPKVPRFNYTRTEGQTPETMWNFTRVPDDEIVACCLWEYARESKTLRLASAVHQMNTRHIRSEGAPEPTKEQMASWGEQDARTRRWTKADKFNYEKFLRRFWTSDFGYIGFYDLLRTQLHNAQPFQSYTKKTRRSLVSKLTEASVFEPLTEALVGDLEFLWEDNNVELLEVRSRVRPLNDDSEDVALYDRTRSIARQFGDERSSHRKLTVAFTIDFSRFADAEIQMIFRQWLLAHRPRHWRKPVAVFPTAARRGRKTNDYRVALERLAIMRLLNQLSPSELRNEIPAAWKLYGHKAEDFRREIRLAVRFFRELFPFLPARECPQSERRFSTWWRPLQRDLARLEPKWGRK